MNRRHFLLRTISLPMAAQAFNLREVRQSLLIDEEIPVHIIVGVHPTADSAESYRRNWNESPFETNGEWYVDSVTTRELPTHLSVLPGTLTHFTATVGVAAQKTQYLVGAFRRENFVYIVRSQADDESLMIAFGDFFAEAALPSLFDVAWQKSNLRALIPTSNELGVPVENTDMRWW